MKFSRYVYFAILGQFATSWTKFLDFPNILYFGSLQFRVFEWDTIYFLQDSYFLSPWFKKKRLISVTQVAWIGFENENSWSSFTSSKISLLYTCFWTCKLVVIHSVVINPFFLDYWQNVSVNFCITICSRHLFSSLLYVRDFPSLYFKIAKSAKLTCCENLIRQLLR